VFCNAKARGIPTKKGVPTPCLLALYGVKRVEPGSESHGGGSIDRKMTENSRAPAENFLPALEGCVNGKRSLKTGLCLAKDEASRPLPT
jgi:hypothetical protein